MLTIDVAAKELTSEELIVTHFCTAVYHKNESQLRAASKELSDSYTKEEIKSLWKNISKDFSVEQKVWVKRTLHSITGEPSKLVMPEKPLSETEKTELEQIESVVKEQVSRGYIKIGQALQEIYEKRLYREYGSFKEYVEEKWMMGYTTACQYIRSFEVAGEISAIAEPANENVVRKLRKLKKPEERIALWKRLTAENPRPNGNQVAEAVAAIKAHKNALAPTEKEPVEILFEEGELVKINCKVGSESRFDGWWGRVESITGNQRYRVKIANSVYVFKPDEVEDCNVSEMVAARIEQLSKLECHVGALAQTYFAYEKLEAWELSLIEYLEKV